jgi:Tfp pilus assembly protein FimT
MFRHLRAQLGFTIGELIAVVGLCGLLSAAMVPVASVIVGHHRLQAATRQLSFEVSRARMQAVGQNVFVRIRLIGTDQYVRERSADGVAFVADGLPLSLPTGQQVTAGETGTPVFNRQGLAPASTSLFVSGPAGQHTLSISVLGRVTVS